MVVLASAVKQEKEIQGMQPRKEVKPYSHRDIFLYIENPMEYHENITRNSKLVQKSCKTHTNTKYIQINWISMLAMNTPKKKIKTAIAFTLTSREQIWTNLTKQV